MDSFILSGLLHTCYILRKYKTPLVIRLPLP